MADVKNVTTGKVRFSFVHLTKPYAYDPGQDEKYSVTCLLPKSDTATKARIDAAIEAAKKEGMSKKWGGKLPAMIDIPVYDGDGLRPKGEPFGPECKGCWVFTPKCSPDNYIPEIVDAYNNPIINPAEIYSGMYGRVNFTAYAYSSHGNNGIGLGLGPVQKLEDGEALSGAPLSAASAFGDPVSDPSSML